MANWYLEVYSDGSSHATPVLMKWIFSALLITLAITGPQLNQRSPTPTEDSIVIRSRPQRIHVYGTRGDGTPIVVSSGDGGWVHLAPHVAQFLAEKGFFVVGFDAKAYLESFTSGASALRPQDEPGDYRQLAEYAARGSTERPILIGVSEGAGLSVLAATDPQMKSRIGGVIGLGLPDINELAWRLKDSIIYITHSVPNEPTFSVAGIVEKVSPIPLATIHSTQDEFVPLAEAQHIVQNAAAPKKLWVVQASDHQFSSNIAEFNSRLLEAIQWVKQNQPR
jgi:fermentation-respiration switch protein FrsA (DUF1100 family)